MVSLVFIVKSFADMDCPFFLAFLCHMICSLGRNVSFCVWGKDYFSPGVPSKTEYLGSIHRGERRNPHFRFSVQVLIAPQFYQYMIILTFIWLLVLTISLSQNTQEWWMANWECGFPSGPHTPHRDIQCPRYMKKCLGKPENYK